MSFVYLHLVLFGGWIALSELPLPFPPFDPTLVVLAMFASVEAIFLSTFVLMNQNQMSAASEERAELDLQVSLLAEHARVVTMLSAICERLDVEQPEPQELADLKRDVAPERVLDRVDEQSAVLEGSRPTLMQRERTSTVCEIPVKAHPETFRFDPSGSRIFVNVPDAHSIAVVDANCQQQVANWGTATLLASPSLQTEMGAC
jgi:hypothetical protein